MLKGFRDFILRGNVIDMAVGIIIGAAFNSVVSALVKDIFTPLIASTVGKPSVHTIAFTFRGGVFEVSDLLNAAISFLIVAAVVYFCIVMPMHFFLQKMKKNDPVPPQPPALKTCSECLSEIPAGARRCAHCGQPQTPVAEPVQATAGQAT